MKKRILVAESVLLSHRAKNLKTTFEANKIHVTKCELWTVQVAYLVHFFLPAREPTLDVRI